MKKLLFILLLLPCFLSAQEKNKRYFMYGYYGQNSTDGVYSYGAYYLETKDNYFPTMEDVREVIIKDWETNPKRVNEGKVEKDRFKIISMTEFKNKREYLRFRPKGL